MTVPALFACENDDDGGELDELTLIVCLVSDKKFRKIGGADGRLQLAASELSPNVLVRNVQPEDLLLFGPKSITEALLKHLCLSSLPKAKRICLKIVHKFNDFSEREDCAGHMDALEAWLLGIHETQYDNVQVRVFDPLPCVRLFYDRAVSGHFIQQFCAQEGFGDTAFWPEFWSPLDPFSAQAGPLIVKPVDACSRANSHWMSLMKEPSGDLVKDFTSEYLMQRFYHHFGILYKVYVVGRSVNVVPRPSVSLSAFEGDNHRIIRFNTAAFKASNPDLSAASLKDAWARYDRHRGEIERFALLLADRLNCSYFGVDVIIPEGQEDKFAVIDINYLPGFDGVEELPRKFIDAILLKKF